MLSIRSRGGARNPSRIHVDFTGAWNRSIVTVLMEGSNGSGFRDLTIPCEKFSLPPMTFQQPLGPTRTLCDVSALALLNPKTSRFVGQVTSY